MNFLPLRALRLTFYPPSAPTLTFVELYDAFSHAFCSFCGKVFAREGLCEGRSHFIVIQRSEPPLFTPFYNTTQLHNTPDPLGRECNELNFPLSHTSSPAPNIRMKRPSIAHTPHLTPHTSHIYVHPCSHTCMTLNLIHLFTLTLYS